MFKEILKDLDKAYEKNKKEKEDSWKKINPNELFDKFDEELKEFKEAQYMKDTYQELVDVLLVGMMLAQRIKPKEDYAP